jgi:hypothetical protein
MANITLTAPEFRQVAEVVEFDNPAHVYHINWQSIADKARELGANFEVRFTDKGCCTVTFFWAYRDDTQARKRVRPVQDQ